MVGSVLLESRRNFLILAVQGSFQQTGCEEHARHLYFLEKGTERRRIVNNNDAKSLSSQQRTHHFHKENMARFHFNVIVRIIGKLLPCREPFGLPVVPEEYAMYARFNCRSLHLGKESRIFQVHCVQGNKRDGYRHDLGQRGTRHHGRLAKQSL